MITEIVSCTIQNSGDPSYILTGLTCDVSDLAYLFIFTLGVVIFFVVVKFVISLLK